jgi:transcriptional regulator with XRE-family HTH domain
MRLDGLPGDFRRELSEARLDHGWSQAELGRRLGLPQSHISGMETGRIVPRFDTFLDWVRVLDRDVLMVPRTMVPAVQSLLRSYGNADEGERPLYATDEESGPE